MKILCLHGYGTSATILQYQLSGLRKIADPSWDFHFISAEIDCPPAPGIEANFPGPYRCWTQSFDADSVSDAYDLVEEAIDEHGPFDGVLGFSQGAGITISYLLDKAAAQPDEVLPFRFAILCSPTAPCTGDRSYCNSVKDSISPEDLRRLQSGQDEQLEQLSEPLRTQATELVKLIKATESITREPPSFFLNRPISEIPYLLHPRVIPTRLTIPTLHLRGKEDLPGSKDCMVFIESLCDSKKQRTFEHSAGHDLPRSGPEVKQILTAVEWVAERSQK